LSQSKIWWSIKEIRQTHHLQQLPRGGKERIWIAGSGIENQRCLKGIWYSGLQPAHPQVWRDSEKDVGRVGV